MEKCWPLLIVRLNSETKLVTAFSPFQNSRDEENFSQFTNLKISQKLGIHMSGIPSGLIRIPCVTPTMINKFCFKFSNMTPQETENTKRWVNKT